MSEQAKQRKINLKAFQDFMSITKTLYMDGKITSQKTGLALKFAMEDIYNPDYKKDMDWLSAHTQLVTLHIEVDLHSNALQALFSQLKCDETFRALYPPTQFYPDPNANKSNPRGPWDESEE